MLLFLDNRAKESRSEILANLHLIKLFIHHTLRFERALQFHGALPKLEANCIEASFAEMQQEGYADDGLFPKMGEFFLPLTISEEELKKTRATVSNQVRQNRLEDLMKQVRCLENSWDDATKHRWDVDEKIKDLNERMKQVSFRNTYDPSQVDTTSKPHDQLERLKSIDREWHENRKQYETKLLKLRNVLDQWSTRITDYEKQIDELNRQINNIKAESSQPPLPVDKGLVKPARGFIMYGPPGMNDLFLIVSILKD